LKVETPIERDILTKDISCIHTDRRQTDPTADDGTTVGGD